MRADYYSTNTKRLTTSIFWSGAAKAFVQVDNEELVPFDSFRFSGTNLTGPSPRSSVSTYNRAMSFRKAKCIPGSRSLAINQISSGRPSTTRSSSTEYWGRGVDDPLWGYDKDPLDFSALVDRAMEKIYGQIHFGANLAVDLAEAHKTAQMIKNVLSVRRIWGDFLVTLGRSASYRRTSGQKRLDLVTKTWLEYKYGWLPLVSSVYNIVETLTKRPVGVITLKGRASKGYTDTEIMNVVDRCKHDANLRVEVGATFSLPPLGWHDFTSYNPLAIAWELTPYSFVGDWFLDIGGYLEAIENYSRFASYFSGGYLTYTSKLTERYERRDLRLSPITYGPNGEPSPSEQTNLILEVRNCTRDIRYKTRTVLTALPFPHVPRVKVSLGASRYMSAVSLLHQAMKKKF